MPPRKRGNARNEHRDARRAAAPIPALSDPDPAVRIAAAGGLIFSGDRASVPALVRALSDPEPRVRQHALFALERRRARAAAPRMAALLADDPDRLVRFNAARALAAVAGPGHAAAFVRALGDPSNDVVSVALQALARHAPGEIPRRVLALVRDRRAWNARPETWRDVVLRLLHDHLGRADVRSALRGLLQAGLRRARAEGRPPAGMELFEAARLLAEAGDPAGTPVLVHALGGGEYSQEKALAALVALGASGATPAIVAGPLRNGFYTLKLAAVRALGEIGDARAVPALAAFLNGRNDDWFVEPSTIFAKDDPGLQLEVLTALARIADRRLRAAARSPDAFERRCARECAARLRPGAGAPNP